MPLHVAAMLHSVHSGTPGGWRLQPWPQMGSGREAGFDAASVLMKLTDQPSDPPVRCRDWKSTGTFGQMLGKKNNTNKIPAAVQKISTVFNVLFF